MRLTLRLLLALALCTPTWAAPIDLPYRQQNWQEDSRGGSCTHCAVIVLCYAAGEPALGRAWFYAYHGGETSDSLHEKLRKANIPFAYTDWNGDVGFLEWAMSVGLPCGVAVNNRSHCVVLTELTETQATLVDPNDPFVDHTVPREAFLASWRASGSWAFCLVFHPVTPRNRSHL